MNRKKKDGAVSGSSEPKEQSKAREEACGDSGVPAREEIEINPGAEPSAKAETDEKAASEADAKEPSEADILKVYLKQTLEEVKRQKDENAVLKAEAERQNANLNQLKERYDSLAAEYENYRRRTSAEKENLGTDATAKAALALLPALDNLERAMPFAQSNPESFTKGVEMTLRQLIDAFKSLGVEEIEAAGAVFDPSVHEAVMHEDNADVGESVVTDVFQKGYRLGEKIVRHSVVKVAN